MFLKLTFLSLVLLLLPKDLTEGVKVYECGPMAAKINSVQISTCLDSESDICTLRRNSDPEISIDFTYHSDSVARVANVTVNAFLSDAFLPRAIVAPPTLFDGCAFGVKCPIEGGTRNEFKAPIPVRTQNIPPFEVALSYRMRDGEGPLLLCFHLFVTVGGPK